jgi:hypothetical protein
MSRSASTHVAMISQVEGTPPIRLPDRDGDRTVTVATDESVVRSLCFGAGQALDVGVRIVGINAFEVGPRSHTTNPPAVFDGPTFDWPTESDSRDEEALAAVRRFIAEHGPEPNQNSWTDARMSPCERTIRRRFGSFEAATELAVRGSRRLLGN